MITEESGVITFVLPPFLAIEKIEVDETRMDSEGYTSKVFMCCK